MSTAKDTAALKQLTDALAQQVPADQTDGLGRRLDQAGRRFWALRNLAGYRGPINQDSYPVPEGMDWSR